MTRPRKHYPDNVPTLLNLPHRWIVLRGCAEVEGRWVDLDKVGVDPDTDAKWVERPGECFGPTDRFERRPEDGVTGRVYEWRC